MLACAPAPRRLRIFVSSTRDDLLAERSVATEVIDRLRVTEFVGMERFGARPSSPVEASLAEVDFADVYVGILGSRYGEVTELEFRRATERRIPCYFFLKASVEREKELDRWMRQIFDKATGWIVEEFKSPSQLATALSAALTNHVIADWTATELLAAAEQGDAERIFNLAAAIPTTDVVRRLLLLRGIDGGVDVIAELTRRARALRAADADPKMMRASVENFIRSYIGRPDDPVPFGGRAAELMWLHDWIGDDSRPPYLLVAEEAGRGKSALLVHFAQELLGDPAVHLVFFPISVRFGLNLAAVVFPALAFRLAAAHDALPPTNMSAPVKAWQELVLDYSSRPLPSGRKLVVILDGLDEAADWSAEPGLFPADAPPGLRVVASARLVADASSAAEWRRLLGWESSRTAESIGLDPLGPEGLRDVIVRMGVPVAELASRPEILGQLQRLTGGHPLLVSLYVRELWSKGDEAPFLSAEDLESMAPGFGGFFKRWWEEQLSLWGKDAPLWQKSVRHLLSIFCMSFGGLRREDLLTLLVGESDASGFTLDLLLKPLRRFLIGGPHGYTFNHPLYARYVREEMLLTVERERCDAELIAWGQSVVRALDEGILHPTDAPPYVVQYLSTHLRRAGAAADDHLHLLTPSWRSAWEALGGGLSGFAADVVRTLEALVDEPGRVDDEIYCAVLLASIRSLAQNLPPALLVRFVEEGQWSRAAALAYVRAMVDSIKKAEALVRIGRLFDGPERMAIDAQALEIERVERERTSFNSFPILFGCAKLPVDRVVERLGETNNYGKWSCFRRLAADGRWTEIIAVAKRFRGSRRMDVLMIAATAMLEHGRAREAYPLLAAIEDSGFLRREMVLQLLLTALDALPRLAPVLVQRWPVAADFTICRYLYRIADVLEATDAGSIPPRRDGDVAWVSLLVTYYRSTRLPAILRTLSRVRPCLEGGLATGIMEMMPPDVFPSIAAALLAFAADDERTAILERLDPGSRAGVRALIASAAYIPERKLMDFAGLLEDSASLVTALVAVQRHGAARKIAEERIHALAALLPQLTDQQRREVTDAILDEIESDEEMIDSGRRQLERLIPFLSPDQLGRAIAIARRIDDGSAQRAARIGLRGVLPIRHRPQWLEDVIDHLEDEIPYSVVTGLLVDPRIAADLASWVATTVEFDHMPQEILLMVRDLPDAIAVVPLERIVSRMRFEAIALLSAFGRPLPADLAVLIPEAAKTARRSSSDPLYYFPTCLWFVDAADRPEIARKAFADGLSPEDANGAQRTLALFLSRDQVELHFRSALAMFPPHPGPLPRYAEVELLTAVAVLSPALTSDQMDELIAHTDRRLIGRARSIAALEMLPFANDTQRQTLRKLLESGSSTDFHAALVAKLSDYFAGELPQRTLVEAIQRASVTIDPVALARETLEHSSSTTTIVIAHVEPLLANALPQTLRDMIAVIADPNRSCLRERLLFDIATLRRSIAVVYGTSMPKRVLAAIERACRVFP
ncbi:MAG TPA: DUF4062 domain-containing protein [Thermoanaerobaculia bacterium]|nr:DUF4062 domain-containing protein [Thermoanaerobaculia bacterium]